MTLKDYLTWPFQRPREELYDLSKDPFQMNNLAELDKYMTTLKSLSNQLRQYLIKTKDPRELGEKLSWDNAAYYKDRDKKPKPSEKARQMLGLKKEYNYLN